MPPPVQRRRVLLVEDDVDLLALLQAQLSTSAHVIGAQTARAASEALASNVFDAVVSDLQLGDEEGGLWVLAEARRLQPGIRCVLMTGSNPPELPDTAVLAKPFGPKDLLELLE